MKNIKIRTIIAISILIISLISSLYFGTNLFSKNIQPQTIKLYYGGPNKDIIPTEVTISGQGTQQTIAEGQKYKVDEMQIFIPNPFEKSTIKFKLLMGNYTEKENFWIAQGDGSAQFDQTKFWNYQNENLPDFILDWEYIHNGYLPIWIEPFVSTPDIDVQTNEFLQEINYYTYSGEFFIDTKFESGNFSGELYFPTESSNITINLLINKKYKIISPSEYTLEKYDDITNKLTFKIIPNKLTSVGISDPEKEKTSNTLSWISGILFASLLGYFIKNWIDKDKFKKENSKQ